MQVFGLYYGYNIGFLFIYGIIDIILLLFSIKVMESKAPLFKHNEIIWAKVSGHPWWPGIIHQLQDSQNLDMYRVDFFGYPPSHSLLPANKIIKYKDHNKIPVADSNGRASPGLKKAISEASVLFHTLEQSKSSPACKLISQLSIYDNDNTTYTLEKTEQKIASQNLIKNQQCPLSFSENQLAQAKKPKLIHKMNSKARINRQKKESKCQKVEQKLEQMLKEYKLDIIPEVQREVRKKQMGKLVRFIYKISRSKYSIHESRQKALFYKDKISSLKELEQFIARSKQEVLQNCTRKTNNEL